VRLKHLDEWNRRRAKIAAFYLEELRETELVIPAVCEGADPVWHLFVVRSRRRDELQQYLKSQGVNTLVHYPVPPHLQKAYRDLRYSEGSFPISEGIHSQALSLPIGPHLSQSATERVIQAVRLLDA